jgi:hypothetical protein
MISLHLLPTVEDRAKSGLEKAVRFGKDDYFLTFTDGRKISARLPDFKVTQPTDYVELIKQVTAQAGAAHPQQRSHPSPAAT